MRTIGKVLLLPVLGALSGGAVLVAGLVDFSASKRPGHFEERVAQFVLDRSIERHARKEVNPLASSPEAARAGLRLFLTHCVACHGAPGVDPTEGGANLNPPGRVSLRRAFKPAPTASCGGSSRMESA